MIRKTLLAVLIVFLISAIAAIPAVRTPAQNQVEIEVSRSSISVNFPAELKFSCHIESEADITDVRLRYKVDQMTFVQAISEVFISVSPGRSLDVNYTLDMRKFGGFPPGANLQYWWLVKNQSGFQLETSPVPFQVQDNRYSWKNRLEGNINLFWYQGNDAFASALMGTAQQALVKMQQDTGAVPDRIVNIYIYNGASDLQGSMIYPSEWTGGVAFTAYNIIAIGIAPSALDWGKRAMTHELNHIVINQVTFNPYSGLPVWLNEGLAMYSEGELTAQYSTTLSAAANSDNLLSVRTISSPFSASAGKATLSYAESYSLVDYLIQEYGPGKMQELLQTFKSGNTYDGALTQIFGFDTEGLNDRWQTWLKARSE